MVNIAFGKHHSPLPQLECSGLRQAVSWLFEDVMEILKFLDGWMPVLAESDCIRKQIAKCDLESIFKKKKKKQSICSVWGGC